MSYGADGQPVKDEHGNVVGGLRLPPIDVPVATYQGATCALFGQNFPLDPATLSELYPTHDAYLGRLRAATDQAINRGWIMPQDAAELLSRAERSTLGTVQLPF